MSPRFLHTAACLGGLLVLSACTSNATKSDPALTREDVLWLNRVTYGINATTVAEYRRVGRAAFLREQLAPRDTALPPQIAQQIDALPVSHAQLPQVMSTVDAEKARNKAITDPMQLEQGRRHLRERGEQFTEQAIQRNLLLAVYSPAQLQEQLVWFWLDHFNVYSHTHDTKWMLGDYEENAIRRHALGHFRDLVLATLEHPAMLQYLDNEQNAAGQLNENYARELMELHTLGVDAGYSQHDVQELARILTGFGINTSAGVPELKPELRPLYRREGIFEFNPARHDFGSKTLLGQPIAGSGFDEVEQAVTLLVHQPACAQFISRKLAMYFVADDPPPRLIGRMARTFQKTDGDIAAVLGVMFASPEFTASLGQKFKDPMHYIVAAMRLAYDDRPIANVEPVVHWLGDLGEQIYGRQTPDGYPLTQDGWASSGQMAQRLAVAHALAAEYANLFQNKDGGVAGMGGYPHLVSRVYFDDVEPYLSARTAATLERSGSQQEWNALLLASPEFNYR
jgi:uncharacterized protein (DUF1800 family)